MVEPVVDRDVIEACQTGDREAFRQLFECYKDRVFSIACYSLGGDEAAANDVTQQIFLKLMTSIRQFRGDSAFTTWLYRLVINACTDEHRKRKRFLPFGDLTPVGRPDQRKSQETRFARREIGESVQAAIKKLSPKLQLPILLKYVEEMSYEEIAKVLGCSKGTVASRLNRGHRALAKRLAHLRQEVSE
ncbi:MAG TPA: sigma-70 family RNA polymerase sigma factor [Pyrinomonadaceae bacterium]|nr:sigma-70 family RNA polymerase sigma factor [Pyrinomonadaceae bacterium]